jgi:hypothetical protein
MAKKKNHLDKVKASAESLIKEIENRKPLTGRPTIYTKELAESICRAIENSPRGLRFICANNPDFPTDETIRDWLRDDKFPGFSSQYARARKAQADYLADEVVEVSYEAIPDNFGRVEKAKLQAESLKWKAKVTKPKVYGDNPPPDEKEDELAKTTKDSLIDRVSKITNLITRKNKINGEQK